ncbi:hypothetical protein NECID01_0306 [Nematocida sp. AWRm77]|nr:hypothetical protein NECID01_0306 [Nematocida sp. AWRm77]
MERFFKEKDIRDRKDIRDVRDRKGWIVTSMKIVFGSALLVEVCSVASAANTAESLPRVIPDEKTFTDVLNTLLKNVYDTSAHSASAPAQGASVPVQVQTVPASPPHVNFVYQPQTVSMPPQNTHAQSYINLALPKGLSLEELEKKIYREYTSELYMIYTTIDKCNKCCICKGDSMRPCGRRIVGAIMKILKKYFPNDDGVRVEPSQHVSTSAGLFKNLLADEGHSFKADVVKKFITIPGMSDLKIVFLTGLEMFVPYMCNSGACSFCSELYNQEGFMIYRGVRFYFSEARELTLIQRLQTHQKDTSHYAMPLMDYLGMKDMMELIISLLQTTASKERSFGTGPFQNTREYIRNMLTSFGLIPYYNESLQMYCFKKVGSPGQTDGFYQIPSAYNKNTLLYQDQGIETRFNRFQNFLNSILDMDLISDMSVVRMLKLFNPLNAFQTEFIRQQQPPVDNSANIYRHAVHPAPMPVISLPEQTYLSNYNYRPAFDYDRAVPTRVAEVRNLSTNRPHPLEVPRTVRLSPVAETQKSQKKKEVFAQALAEALKSRMYSSAKDQRVALAKSENTPSYWINSNSNYNAYQPVGTQPQKNGYSNVKHTVSSTVHYRVQSGYPFGTTALNPSKYVEVRTYDTSNKPERKRR